MMTDQLDQIAQQIEQLNMIALQQSVDPSVFANVENFAHQSAITRRSIADMQAAANGLVEFMNAFQAVVFVPPPHNPGTH